MFFRMAGHPGSFDPAIQTEDIGFRSDELISCVRCGRQNAPNRLDCLYCGAGLDVDPRMDKFPVRKLDPSESGTSIVITGGTGDTAMAGELLSIDGEQLEAILSAGVPLPVAWIGNESAVVLTNKLEELGYLCVSIRDTDVALSKPPIRVAGMWIEEDGLTLIGLNTRDEYRYAWAELLLAIQGIFSTSKIESMEKRGLRKTTVLSDTATTADEPVLDLYTFDDSIGYRVRLAGFDYSCLGDRMSVLATENMNRLIDALRSRSPRMKVVDDYKRLGHLLTGIWDVDSRKDPKGQQRVGFGKRAFGVVRSTSNVAQFTRFSRLQRLML